jgi:hypothetical protein
VATATIASVVMSRPATDAAPCNAARTGEDGSVVLGKILEKDQYAFGSVD